MRICVSIALILALSGCAAMEYRASLDAYGEIAPRPKTYCLIDLPSLPRSDITNREIYENIDRSLQLVGFVPAPYGQCANLISALWGVGPREQWERTAVIPRFGQIPTGSTTTGRVDAYGNLSAQTTNNYTTGITGHTTVRYTESLSPVGIALRGSSPNNPDRTEWLVSASAMSESGDPRRVIPYLLSAINDYIGVSSGRTLHIELMENASEVRAIRGE